MTSLHNHQHTAIAASLATAYGSGSNKRPKLRRPPPEAFGDDAVVDATFCASGGSVSLSWWHAKVASGEAPEPVIRAPRFTRWRLGDVRKFWIDFVAKAALQTQVGQDLQDRATKASAAAKAVRQARAKAATPPQA